MLGAPQVENQAHIDSLEIEVVEFAAPGRLRRSSRRLDPAAATLDVEAVGVCGTDRHIYRGTVPVQVGTVMGHEIIGRIGRLPEGIDLITDWRPAPGDRVVLAPGISCLRCRNCLRHGMYCENRRLYGLGTHGTGPHGGMSRTVELWPGTRLFRVPDDMDPRRAVFIEPLACAVRAVATALPVIGPLATQAVIVVGFGPMGFAVAAVARAHGAQITVVDPDESRRKLAAGMGFGILDEGGGGCDLAVECAGTPAAFETAVGLVRRGGAVVEMGNFADTGAGRLAPSEICLRDLRILGTSVTRDEDFYAAITIASSPTTDLPAAVTRIWAWSELTDPNQLFSDEASKECKQMIVMEDA